jgi:chemotaxis protein CheD
MEQAVGISEMKVSSNPNDVLIAYSLGSCIGLSLYDPVIRMGGMIHCMLPESKIDSGKAHANPCMFTDTGVPELLQAMIGLGGAKHRLIAKVAGAAGLLEANGAFKIGERNYIVLRKILWNNSISIAAEDTGGTIVRTMCLHIGTGKTTVRSRGEERELAQKQIGR